jgi:hypothetical protein
MGCFSRIAIVAIILLIIASWAVPSLFHDEIEARVCPEGSELRSYSRTTNGNNTTQGHACYGEGLRESRDLGAHLIIPSILMTIVGIFAIVFLIVMGTFRSARQTLATLPNMQGATIIRSGQSIGFNAQQGSNDDLAEKLQQLNEALNAGLITQDEYEAKRREIMDEF